MGLWGDVGRGAAGWSTGGLSELFQKDPFGLGGNGYNPATYKMKPPMQASDVKLPTDDLAGAFKKIGAAGTAGIGATYARAKDRTNAEAATRGMRAPGPNSYSASRYRTQQGLDQGALEASLAGQLGNTAYSEAKAQRGYDQNMSLTDQIAAANKPSMLDEIFSGIGSVGGAAGKFGALAKRMPKTATYPMTTQNNDSIYDPYADLG